MAPSAQIARHLLKRLEISVPNPLKDKGFIGTVVGLIAGAVAFLLIIALILLLYRDDSPLQRCRGGNRKPAKIVNLQDVPIESRASSRADSQVDLVKKREEDITTHKLQSSSWVDSIRSSVYGSTRR
jgi:hypothetical protein